MPQCTMPLRTMPPRIAENRGQCYIIPMLARLTDPLALTAGIAPRVALAGGAMLLIWLAVFWAMG